MLTNFVNKFTIVTENRYNHSYNHAIIVITFKNRSSVHVSNFNSMIISYLSANERAFFYMQHFYKQRQAEIGKK